jgi:hypothetical protein
MVSPVRGVGEISPHARGRLGDRAHGTIRRTDDRQLARDRNALSDAAPRSDAVVTAAIKLFDLVKPVSLE